jgi:hypothetical protein
MLNYKAGNKRQNCQHKSVGGFIYFLEAYSTKLLSLLHLKHFLSQTKSEKAKPESARIFTPFDDVIGKCNCEIVYYY